MKFNNQEYETLGNFAFLIYFVKFPSIFDFFYKEKKKNHCSPAV